MPCKHSVCQCCLLELHAARGKEKLCCPCGIGVERHTLYKKREISSTVTRSNPNARHSYESTRVTVDCQYNSSESPFKEGIDDFRLFLRDLANKDYIERKDMIGNGLLYNLLYVIQEDSSPNKPKITMAGGAESLIYVTVTGRVGALVPFTSRDDVEFYTKLEGRLRTDAVRPTGRDPQSYRSYYAPIKHVVDGDLCASFNALSYEEQNKIATHLDRTVGEVLKKLEDTRNGLL